jgi:hypothetical protein
MRRIALGDRPVLFRGGEAMNPCADCVRVVEAEAIALLLERVRCHEWNLPKQLWIEVDAVCASLRADDGD